MIAWIVDQLIDEDDIIDGMIKDALRDESGFANSQTLFSIRDFLDGLRPYGDEIEQNYNNLPAKARLSIWRLW